MNTEIINATKNIYGGVIVEPTDLPEIPDEFAARLEYSLRVWASEGAKVVWLSTARSQAALIPIAVALGFVFHHALEDSLQMTYTLIPGSTIPPFATHYVGAGGVVLREDGGAPCGIRKV
ncbi:hypothetical protein [Treponema primitia]|uniref:hypothetical protein n=1 Tax=Treponema primitia TaxID=88058 RepID=UPI000474F8AF|nr:hypothetical protein [Treponema primitia]